MMNRTLTALSATVILSALVAVPSAGQDPYMQPDNSWISIDGTVESVGMDEFVLDYGDGVITVEMDDADRDADAYALAHGDRVRVTGKVDDDFLEVASIEAASVYVQNLGTYFYASAADEEDLRDDFVTMTAPVHVGQTVLQGTVTDVEDDEFTLDTGPRRITVETEEMPYDPMDDEGYQHIRIGDRVSVSGDIDTDLFEGSELVAETIVSLSG
jgi:uncharacterized protein YdeI (BOF family)